ncbi:MAG: hypothetical protein HQK88_01120 [Nitrospirae bacterium]|nr:hypothetical protein [Nitrospirota bacterium]MBF0533895.1 hypothetical protein [Nitrospirota bacterium]MBF0615396.1 hypothetical protein [Nitrospirota bacterium]
MLRCVGLGDVAKIVFLVFFGGVMGGIASFFLELVSNAGNNKRPSCFYLQKGNGGVEVSQGNSPTCVITNDNKKLCRKMYIIHLLVRGFIGAAGAFGGLLVLFVTSRFPKEPIFTTGNMLFLLSFFVVSGYASDRLLPAISNALLKRIEEVEKRQVDAIKDVETLKSEKDKLHFKLNVSDARTFGYHALSSPTTTNISLAINKVETVLSTDESLKIDRSMNFLLVNLYKQAKNYEKAIDIINKFIESMDADKAKSKSPELPEKEEEFKRNIADAHFHKACLYSLQAEKLKDSDGAAYKQMIQTVFDELKMSFDNVENKEAAKNNKTDFNSIKEEAAFKELVNS